ncbi:MAG: hypothetical protein GY792_25995 [Gammaproteobacteria bacterium]|nr:hypothetical protein [Gammaproteobacteria bacterium]
MGQEFGRPPGFRWGGVVQPRHCQRQRLLESDVASNHLAGETVKAGPMDHLLSHSTTHWITVGPQGFHPADPASL